MTTGRPRSITQRGALAYAQVAAGLRRHRRFGHGLRGGGTHERQHGAYSTLGAESLITVTPTFLYPGDNIILTL